MASLPDVSGGCSVALEELAPATRSRPPPRRLAVHLARRQSPSRTSSNFSSTKGLCFACGMARCRSRARLWWSFPHLYYVQRSEIAGSGLHDWTGPFFVEDASCWMVGLRQPGNHSPSRGSATASSCGSSSMFGVCILSEASTCCPARRQGRRLSPKNGGGRWTG